MPDEKPKFDPNKKFEPVNRNASSKPAFNPDADYEPLKKKVESQPYLTGQKTPLQSFQAGLATSQSANQAGLRTAGIAPEQKTPTQVPLTGLDVKPENIKAPTMSFGEEETVSAPLQTQDVRSKVKPATEVFKPVDAQGNTADQTEFKKDGNDYRTNTLADGTEVWEVKRQGQKDFTVLSNPGSISSLNKSFKKNVPPEKTEIAEKRRQEQIKNQSVLNSITPQVIASQEEQVVPFVNNQLKQLGVEDDFLVEEIGTGTNAIQITNKVTGEKQRVSLSNFSAERDKVEADVLKAFIGNYAFNKDYYQKKKQINELSVYDPYKDVESHIEDNKNLNKLKDEVKTIEKSRDKYISDDISRATAEKNVKQNIENYKTELNGVNIAMIDLQTEAQEFQSELDNFNAMAQAGGMSQEEFETRRTSLAQKQQELKQKQEQLVDQTEYAMGRIDFNEDVVANAYKVNSERGNILSGTAQAFTRGMEAPLRMIGNAFERQSSSDPDYIPAEKSAFGDDEYGWSAGVSTLDYTKSANRDDFSKAIFGVAESLGSAATGALLTGGVLTGGGGGANLAEKAANLVNIGTFASMYNSSRDQMEGPEFKDVPLAEKVFLSTIIAAPQMVLEQFGLSQALKGTKLGKTLSNNILSKVLTSLPKGASSEVIETAIKKNVTELIKDGVLKVNKLGLIEAGTEASQYLTEVGIGELYNKAKGKDLMETPNSFMELVENVGENAKIGYIGGVTLGGASKAITQISGGNKLSKSDYSTLENTLTDPDLNKAFSAYIETQLLNGEITPEEAQRRLENASKMEEKLASIPKELDEDSRREAFNLIQERDVLEERAAPIDKSLAKYQTDRISEINTELEEIGKKASESQLGMSPAMRRLTGQQNQSEEKTESTTTTTTETTTEQENSSPEKTAETVQQPNVIQEEGLATEYTDPEGKFYSEKEVLEMNPEQRSSLTLQNPSVEVMNAVQPMPEANTAMETNVAPNTSNSRELETPVQSEPVAITKPTDVSVGQTLVDIDGKESVVTAIDGNMIIMDRDGSEFRANPKVVELFTKPEATISKTETVQESIPVVSDISKRTDEQLKQRWEDLGDNLRNASQQEKEEFLNIENELEKREFNSVHNVSIEEAISNLDKLYKANDGFMERRETRESKEVLERYLNPEFLTDKDITEDFRKALNGNVRWNPDSLLLKLAIQESLNRGVSQQALIDNYAQEFIRDGFTKEDAIKTAENKINEFAKINKKYNSDSPSSTPSDFGAGQREEVTESKGIENDAIQDSPTSANNAPVQNEVPAEKPVRTKAEIESEQEKLFTRAMGLKQNEYDRLISEGVSESEARKQSNEFAESLPEAKRYDELNDEINSLPENNPAQETFSEQSNITEEMDNTVANTDGINNEADLGNTDTSSESKPAPEKQEKSSEKKPKKKVSKQADRFSEMQDKETSKRIKELASYDVQNQEEFSSAMDEIINTLGVDGAVDYVNDLDNKVAPEVRIAILTEAGASISQDAMEAKAKALKAQDLEALRQADAMLEKGMALIIEASLYKTKAGQINSYTRKTYSKYPSVFQVELTEKFNRSYGATEQVRKDVSEIRDGIQEGLSGVVDDVFSDAYVLERMQEEIDDLRNQIGILESRQNEKQNRREEKVRNARKKFEAAKAKFNGTGQISGSIAFLSSEQIEAIGEMTLALVEMGYANTNKIVSEIYNVVRQKVPNARKEHIRQAALNINEFNVMQQAERQQSLQTREELLRRKLADLQKGKENIDEVIREDDSDEIKALKQQIANERILTPKVIRQLVKDFLAGKIPNVSSLAQALAQKTGATTQEMQDMADIIQETLDKRIEELVSKEHDRFVDKQDKRKESTESLRQARRDGTITAEQRAELEDRIENARTRQEIEKIMALLRSGRLNDTNEFTRAFEKRFGFRQLPSHVKAQLDAIAFQIFEMEKQVTKEIIDANGDVRVITIARKEQIGRLQKQFNTLLESSKPWTVARVLKEIVSAQYVNMLSGPLTFVRAFYGGYSSGLFGALSYTVRNITTNPKAVLNGTIAAWRSLPSAYRRAVQSRKTGYDLFGQSSLKGDTNQDSQGWYEKTMLTGLSEALANKEYGKATLKLVGQLLKVIHALGGLDAFMNTVSGAYIGTIKQSRQQQYDAAMNETLDQDYRSIAEEEFQESTKRIQDFVEMNFPNLTAEQKYEKVNKLMKSELGLTGSRLNARKTYMINRVQELREQALGDLFVEGVQLAKDASMMGTPDGYAGLLVEKYLKPVLNIKDEDSAGVAVGKFFLNAIFKFVRITGQLINKTFNNIPVLGIANAFIGPGYNPKTGEFDTRLFKGKINSNPDLLKQRIFNNLLITAMTVTGYLLMFEDDEEEGWKLKEDRPFDLRAFGKGGQGGKYANERKYEDFQNLSISFSKDKDGNFTNYISFRLNPEISAVISTLGSLSDMLKGDATDKQLRSFQVSPYRTAFWKAIGDNAKIFTESSFSSIGRIVKNIQGEENFFEGLGTAGQNLLIDNARPLINPASFQSITKAVEASGGENQKETKGWEYLANNLYGLDGFINDEKTDVFGNKFPEENDYKRFMKEFIGEGEKRSETFKNAGLLYKFDEGLNISKRKFAEMLPTAPKGFAVTYSSPFGEITEKFFVNDETIAVEAQNIQETEFNRSVNESYKYLNSLETKEELEEAMKELQNESVTFAKMKIVEKYQNTKKIEMQE